MSWNAGSVLEFFREAFKDEIFENDADREVIFTLSQRPQGHWSLLLWKFIFERVLWLTAMYIGLPALIQAGKEKQIKIPRPLSSCNGFIEEVNLETYKY